MAMTNSGKPGMCGCCWAAALLLSILLLRTMAANGTGADSLRQQLRSAPDDTTYIKTAIQLSGFYERIDLDTAYHFAQLALTRSRDVTDAYWHAEALNSMGIIHDFRGNYLEALQHYDQALSIYRELGLQRKTAIVFVNIGVVQRIYGSLDSSEASYQRALAIAEEMNLTTLQAYILNNLANVHYLRGNLLQAVDHTLESLRLKEKVGDEEGVMYGSYNLGNYYYELKIADKAHEFFNASLARARELRDSLCIGDCYYSLGMLYHNRLHKPDSARHFMERSYDIRKRIGYKEGEAGCLNKLGSMALDEGQLSAARQYLDESLVLSRSLQDPDLISVTFINLSRLALAQNELIQASTFADSGLAYAQLRNTPQRLAEAYRLQMSVHRAMENYAEAFEYHDLHERLDDSLLSAETTRQIAELETMYQVEKKDRQILTKELEVKERDRKLRQQERQLLALGAGGLAVMAILGLIIRNNRARRKLHRQELKRLENEKELQLLKAMIAGEEKERTRISKDLHDGVSGLLSTVKLYFSSLGNDNKAVAENEVFVKAKKLLDESSSEVRKVAHNLMPELLRKEGLPHAVREFCDNIRGSKMLDIEFQALNMNERLSPSLELMLYRIIQELVNNIIKHANATEAIVQISRHDDLLQLTIEDNGHGFESHDDEGAGLDSIKNRINLLDGNLRIQTSRELGTSINIEVYLNKATTST